MERRKHPRIRIQVDLEMAIGDHGVFHGMASNISRDGISLVLEEGGIPELDKAVILTFKIWTGRERLSRSLTARVVRVEGSLVGLTFDDHDAISDAAIHDLLFYLQFDRRQADGDSAA